MAEGLTFTHHGAVRGVTGSCHQLAFVLLAGVRDEVMWPASLMFDR
jgi:hypothetical protein